MDLDIRAYGKILENLTLAAERAYNRGIQMGSGGNLSARVPGQELMIISASGSSFIDCDTEGRGWVLADFAARPVNPDGPAPSKESVLHGFLYSRFPEIMSIVHCHAPWTITWANAADTLPLSTWQAVTKLGVPVPIFEQHQPAVSKEECEVICQTMRDMLKTNCFIMREHGVVALGKDAVAAEHQAEFVEETAKIAMLKKLAGIPIFSGTL